MPGKNTLKVSEIRKSLKKKGFQEADGDHKYYTFYYQGKKTSVFTKISHGAREIGEPLIGMMAKQTRISKPEFQDLVHCPLSMEQYIVLLKERKYLE